jgi:hypothetical protein
LPNQVSDLAPPPAPTAVAERTVAIQPPLHRMFHHFSEMPYSQRVLFTATLLVLGLGYLFALTYIVVNYAGRAGGNPLMLTYEDIVAGYAGTTQGSRLEAALSGPMRDMLSREEGTTIIAWLGNGAKQPGYVSDIKPIIDKRCMICHDGSNPHIPNLSDFDNIRKVTAADTGTPVTTLVRLSHIHLFGLTFIFFIMGLMFSHAYVRPVWFKCTVIALPFAATVSDVSGWYLTKVYHPFAWIVIGGGSLMALSFAYMWLTTMYQLWFSHPPRAVLERRGGDIPAIY